jgi:hypothetical protein
MIPAGVACRDFFILSLVAWGTEVGSECWQVWYRAPLRELELVRLLHAKPLHTSAEHDLTVAKGIFDMSRLVIIDRRLSLPEAVVRGSMLEAYRIPVALGGGAHAFMHWFALFAIGGVTLQVPEVVSETADVLLKPVDPGGELRESPRFWRRPIRNAVGAALVFVGLPLPFWLVARDGFDDVGDRAGGD